MESRVNSAEIASVTHERRIKSIAANSIDLGETRLLEDHWQGVMRQQMETNNTVPYAKAAR